MHIMLQGEIGPEGDPGIKGAPGTKGAIGAKGDTGAPGAKGDTGMPGTKGSIGVAGVKGPSPKSDDGMNSFNFHGSTGASLAKAPENIADYWSIGDVDGPSTSKGNTAREISTPLGSPCVRIELTLSLPSAPGTGKSWTANIGLRKL
jgi:Collagen triple helix repeat (20 copies)